MALDETISGPGTELWCAGLRFSYRKKLSADERSVLEPRARKSFRRARALTWLTTTAAIGASAAVGLLVFADAPRGLREEASTAFAGMAMALFGCGFLGAAMEIFFGRTVLGRAFFLIAAAMAIVGGPWRFVTAPVVLAAGNAALILVVFLGNAMIILRWREGRREYRLFRLALEDMAAGDVLVFIADGAHAPHAQADLDLPKDVEVLPASNLALRIDGERVATWIVQPVVSVAEAPQSPMEAPLAQRLGWISGGGDTVRQRHLTTQELEELRGLRRRLLRRIPVATLGTAYFLAVLARGVQNLAIREMRNELSGIEWAVGGLLVGAYALKRAMDLRLLDADLKAGIVAVLRPSIPGRSPVSEILPASGLHWTQDGVIALWRTQR